MFSIRDLIAVVMSCCVVSACLFSPHPVLGSDPVDGAAARGVAIEPDPPGFAIVNTQNPKDIPTPAEQSLSLMMAQDGFTIVQSAAEPDVRQPIAFTIDDRGRLWVVENYSYPKWRSEPTDRVLIFEDTTGDGRFDRRRIFWDQGRNLSGIALGFGGVYLTSAPELIFIPIDRDQARPAGEPVVLLDGFNAGSVGHNVVNGLTWGPDGWLYGNHGIQAISRVAPPGTPGPQRTALDCCIWRYHPTGHVFEVVARGTTNPWGFDYDDHGHMFFTNNVNGHLFHMLPGARYIRMYGTDFNPYNYELLKPSTDHKHYQGDSWSASKAAGDGSVDPEHDHLGGGHSHVGAMFYLGDNWPERFRNRIFMFNTHGRRINQDAIERRHSGFIATHAVDLLRANDPWFRGLELQYGPDGGVFFTDWNQFGECHDSDGIYRGSGRIYKLTWGTAPAVLNLNLATLSARELVALQLHRNDWYVRHARRILQERAAEGHDLSAAQAQLHQIFAENPDVTRKLRAMWALQVTGGIDPSWLLAQLAHPQEHIRVWAIRLLVDDRQGPSAAAERFAQLAAEDPSDLVRLHLASALQWMSIDQRGPLARALAQRDELADDPVFPLMLWYGLEPLVAADAEFATNLLPQMKIPQLRRFTARRLTAELDRLPESLERLSVLIATTEDTAVLRDVVAGLQQGLRGRRRVAEPARWEPAAAALADHPDAHLRQGGEALSLIFGDARAGDLLKRLAADGEAAVEKRQEAIQTLASQGVGNLAPLLQQLVGDSHAAIRHQAIRALAAAESHPETPRVLIEHYQQLSDLERRAAIDTLSSRPAYVLPLLDAIEADQIAQTDLAAFHARQIVAFGDQQVTERLSEVWGLVRQISEQGQQRVINLRQMLTAGASADIDPAAGRTLFLQRCAQCHRLFGEGQNVGGDLTGTDRSNLDYLLLKIIDPSATVPQSNRMTLVRLHDGRVLSGILDSGTDATLALRTPAETIVLDRQSIAETKLLDVSLMPEGLLDGLTDSDVRNLFAFLAAGTLPISLEQMSHWSLSASHNAVHVANAIDGDLESRWDSGRWMTPGMWLSIDLKQRYQLARLVLDSRGSDGDYPRGYELAISEDGKRWFAPIVRGAGKGPIIEIQLPPGTITQHLRIIQTGEAKNFWSIHQLTLYGDRPQ